MRGVGEAVRVANGPVHEPREASVRMAPYAQPFDDPAHAYENSVSCRAAHLYCVMLTLTLYTYFWGSEAARSPYVKPAASSLNVLGSSFYQAQDENKCRPC